MPGMQIKIDVEYEKASGKFVNKEDIADSIITDVEASDPGTVMVDDSEYNIVGWDVSLA